MSQGSAPRGLTQKEEILLDAHRSRQERYVRTAFFVQSKWFMLGGAVAIAVFIILMLLVAG
jgi:ABC-type multidrug transport system permease subunit